MAKDGQEVKRRGRKIFAALRRHGDEAPSEEVAPEPRARLLPNRVTTS
ncbi:MAG: hypothetical protein M5U31_04295 [Acidimicrobiia bacterium]|nr:hypothetical protein [Acidimicrobiia bacterium]